MSSVKKGLIFIILLAAACFILWQAGDYFFDIRTIQEDLNGSGDKATLRGLSEFRDQNLLFTSGESIVAYLKKMNPGVEKITVSKVWPDTLRVTATYYKPLAAVAADRGFFIVSSDATVLEWVEQAVPGFPVVNYYQKLQKKSYVTGNKLDFKDIEAALRFLQSSLDLGMKTSKIVISGYHMIALYADKEKIVFSEDKNIDTQLFQFDAIIKNLKAQGKDFTNLDLRFDKPVIVF